MNYINTENLQHFWMWEMGTLPVAKVPEDE